MAHARRIAAERQLDLDQLVAPRAGDESALEPGGKTSIWLLIAAWVLCPFGWFFGIITGLMGLGLAWSFATMKRSFPHKRQFAFNRRTRRLGWFLLTANLISCIICIKLVSEWYYGLEWDFYF